MSNLIAHLWHLWTCMKSVFYPAVSLAFSMISALLVAKSHKSWAKILLDGNRCACSHACAVQEVARWRESRVKDFDHMLVMVKHSSLDG